MTRDDLLRRLAALPACSEAREWAESTPGTPEELWHTCPRGDWLLWLAASAGVDRRLVVQAACDCAETSTPHLTDSTRGPALAALATARRWARGEATSVEVIASAATATAAAATAYAAAAAYAAATATSYAAYAATAATAYAAAAAAAAATYAVGTGARAASLQRSADLVRARIPWADVEALLGGAS